MTRITKSHLEAMAHRINVLTGNPTAYWNASTTLTEAGHYHLDYAYGGVALYQTSNGSGGARDVLRSGHVSKSNLYDRMCAYIYGIEDSKEAK